MNPKLKQAFKGIALFTPGGDLIYSIDQTKQTRWHLNLCTQLQEILGLLEPPHFLIPGYTATIDCWINPKTQKLEIVAEAYPPVYRYQALLNIIFGLPNIKWHTAIYPPELGDPILLETYREQFPILWQNHDLIIHWEKTNHQSNYQPLKAAGYVLRLFVSSSNSNPEQVLHNLHSILEKYFPYSYSLKIIDIVKHPELAEDHQISATPTLIRVWPQPVRRIVGDFTNQEQIMQLVKTIQS